MAWVIIASVCSAPGTSHVSTEPSSFRTAASRSRAYCTLRRVSASPWVMNSGRHFNLRAASSGLDATRSSRGPVNEQARAH
jgi:hypothetical protein